MDKQGDYTFPYESTRVFVNVQQSPWAEESSLVNVFAITNLEVPASADLFKYVATAADSWIFGHLGMREEGDKATLMFRHTLLGDHLDVEELKAAVGAVASTANQIDDEVKARFGGKVFRQLLESGAVSSDVPGYL